MQVVVPLLLGAALAFCMPPTPLGFLAPLPLVWLLTRGGFRYGLWAGIGFWAVHLFWLPASFVVIFDTPLGAVPYLPLVLIKAAMWGAVFGLSRGRPLTRAGLWVVLEWLTSLGEVAFPWGFLGYALVEAPGRLLASLGGVYLLSLVVLGVALALYYGGRGFRDDPVVFSAPAMGVLGAALFWVVLWVAPLPAAEGDQTALLVQGNINPLNRDWAAAPDTYLGLTRQGLRQSPGASVVVWPESAVLEFPLEVAPTLGERVLVSGVFLNGLNSIARVENGRIVESYAKARLVPFGENFPFQRQFGPVYDFFFNAFGVPGLRSQAPANGSNPLGRFAAFICYESVFSSVTRGLVLNGAEVLALGSNDAWYGPSFGGLQHFQMGRLRSVETGRWMLRAGNDGVTAIIDPYGRVTRRIPQRQPGYLSGQFAYLRGQTPYVRLGDWAVLLAGVLAGVGLLIRPRTRII